MNKQDDHTAQSAAPAQQARELWVSPKVLRMRAGEAEMPGGNRITPEGPLGDGS